AAAPAPVAVFLATGAGDLLHHHRAALAPVPVAGATALVVAAAGHAVVPAGPRARAMARRGAVAGGEFRAAAVVHPEGVAALAPRAAFDAGGPRQLPHQHGAAADGAGLPPVVAALAAHQLAVAAAPAAAALGEASTAAVVHPHRAAAAAEVAALDAARAGDVLDQHRATLERGAAFAPAAVVAGAHQGGPGPAGSAPAPAVAAAERAGDVTAYLGHAPAILDPVEVIGQLVVGDGAPAPLRGVFALDQQHALRRGQGTQVFAEAARGRGRDRGQGQADGEEGGEGSGHRQSSMQRRREGGRARI